MQQLRQHLQRINQKSYKAYKDIANTYTFPEFQLAIVTYRVILLRHHRKFG